MCKREHDCLVSLLCDCRCPEHIVVHALNSCRGAEIAICLASLQATAERHHYRVIGIVILNVPCL